MKRIKDFLCKVDPIGLTFILVIGGVYLALAVALGLGEFLLVIIIACVFCAVLLAIGWLTYKIVVFAQSYCHE